MNDNDFEMVGTDDLGIALKKTQILNTQQSLQKYMDLYHQLKLENDQLRMKIREHDESHVQVSGFLQNDVEQRANTINLLQQEVYEQKRKADDQTAELLEELKTNEVRFQMELERRDAIIKEQEQNLLQFERVKRERQILEDVLQQKEKDIVELRKSFENKITLLQLQFVEQKVKLQKESEAMKRSLEENLDQRAMEMIDTKSKEIHTENQELHKMQSKLQENLQQIAKLKQEALEKCTKMERAQELSKDTIRTQAKRTVQLTREVKELRTKVKGLQETLTNVVNKNLHEKKATEDHFMQEITKLQEVNEELRNLLKVRTTELVNLKRLAKRVVVNRSNLEKFFMTSVSEAKHYNQNDNQLEPGNTSQRTEKSFGNRSSRSLSSLPPLSDRN